MKKVERYYNKKNEMAVLISGDYGIGWSTYGNKNIAVDKRIIETFIDYEQDENQLAEKLIKKLAECGYDDNDYCDLAIENLTIEWVDAGTAFQIREYDGAEYIEYFDEDDWYIA